METDDRVLVQQFKQGDKNAFETLVSRYKRRLYSALYRMTRNHEVTDEMLQETFLKLWTSIDSYDENYNFYPWLHRIAINTTINYLNREKKRKSDGSLEEEMEERFLQPRDIKNPFEPESAFTRKERDVKILNALQRLSPPYRAVLILRVYEGFSYKEIADILELSIGTVMSRLNRARGQIRDILGDYLLNGSNIK